MKNDENYEATTSVNPTSAKSGIGSLLTYVVIGLLTFGGGYLVGMGVDTDNGARQEIVEGEEVDENSNFRVQVHTKCESDCIDQRDDDPDFDMAGCSTECELFGLQEPDQVQAIEDEITNKDSKNSKINGVGSDKLRFGEFGN